MNMAQECKDAIDQASSNATIVLIIQDGDITKRVAITGRDGLILSVSILVEDLFGLIHKQGPGHLESGVHATQRMVEDIAKRVESGELMFSNCEDQSTGIPH